MKGMYADSKLCNTMSFDKFLDHYRKKEDNLDPESLFICELRNRDYSFISNGGVIPVDFKKWLDNTKPKIRFKKAPYLAYDDPEYMQFNWEDLIIVDRYTTKPSSYCPPHCLWDLYEQYESEKKNAEKIDANKN